LFQLWQRWFRMSIWSWSKQSTFTRYPQRKLIDVPQLPAVKGTIKVLQLFVTLISHNPQNFDGTLTNSSNNVGFNSVCRWNYQTRWSIVRSSGNVCQITSHFFNWKNKNIYYVQKIRTSFTWKSKEECK
jgi:hypothetical protein